ncbi:MAG: H-type lectin domain-containing protein, partial [Clostridiales bacterium]|nr:H-type lectin domain-containing protein [Clostridiales bacterium]
GSSSYPTYIRGSNIYANSFPIPEIQHGRVSVSVTKETNTEFSVTFDQAFSGTPTVVITPTHTYADASGLGFKILTVSSTGFTGCIYDNAARTFQVRWIAMY